jgi:hypothetical protein
MKRQFRRNKNYCTDPTIHRRRIMRRLTAFLSAVFMIFFAFCVFAQESTIPASLRGGIDVDQQTIDTALEMQKQGWTYAMPRPKSKQAAWGNTDGRTTWWNGYWHNAKTNQYSSITPKLKDGVYIGDGRNPSGWRRGGSPGRPSKFEWLLSKSGGIPPRSW